MMLVGTGNEELDRRLGAIPHPSLIMIEGDPGAGKTIVACQFTNGFVRAGLKAVFISTEVLTFDIANKMRAIKMEVLSHMGRTLRIVPVNVKRFLWDSPKTRNLLSILSNYILTMNSVDLIVVDNLSVLSNLSTRLEILDFLRCCRLLSKKGTTLLFTIHPRTVSETLLTEIKSMTDVSYKVSGFSIAGRRLKSLERTKGIGGQGGADLVSFDIDPSLGVKIVPMSLSRS